MSRSLISIRSLKRIGLLSNQGHPLVQRLSNSAADCGVRMSDLNLLLKTHQYGGIFTLSLKLHVGVVPTSRHGYDYMRELHGSPINEN